jgi:hypothetical protein
MNKKRLQKTPKFYIEMPGMISDCVGNVTIDSKYGILQVHPTYSLAILPYEGEPQPSFEEIVFYVNCLAFEHELPVSIFPVNQKPLIEPILGARGKESFKYGNDTITQAYEALNYAKFGLGSVSFRHPGFGKEINIQYSKKYQGADKELSLYSTALRQLDPLSEFLCYYRIIESVSGNNGKGWIDTNIHRIKTFDFGFLEFGDMDFYNKKRRTNLFSIYRRKATSRLEKLNRRLGPGKLSYYLYNENRCGIAHGKDKVIEYDFNYNVIEVSKDNYIMKLLSRIAIEDKIL